MITAVIKTGGKQYLVQPHQKFKVEKLPGEAGAKVSFSEVLLIADSDKVTIGQPLVKGAEVIASIFNQGRGKKIIVQKYKPKVRYRKKMGHRQHFTELSIDSINL